MNLWKDTNRANAQVLIDWLLSSKVDTGWPVTRINKVALAELGSSSPHAELTESLVMQVLGEMHKNNRRTVDDFEEIYEQKRKSKAIDASGQVARWNFLIPIKVNINNDLVVKHPRIRILGKAFSFLSLASVDRRLDRKTREALRDPSHIKFHTGIQIEDTPKVFLSVSARAVSWNLAWKDITPAFDAFRGLIELSFDFYGWRISGDRKSARRKFPHPIWMLACKKDTSPYWVNFITDEDSTAKAFELNDARITGIKKNAAFLQREPKPQSTLSLVADCLRLYSQAMDAHLRHLCFLGFWQLAEAITHSETVGGNTDKVIARLAWHGTEIGLKGSGYKETLRAFGKKRNDIVHRGIHEIEDDEINILKLACEAALDWLFRVHKTLPTTAHVEHYYRLREMNQTDIEAIKGCVDYLMKRK